MDEKTEQLLSLWRHNNMPDTPRNRQIVWDYLGSVVSETMKRLYRQTQNNGYVINSQGKPIPHQQDKVDVHHDRILILAEWLRLKRKYRERHEGKTVCWEGLPPLAACLYTYQKNASAFEVLRRLRNRGVHVPISAVRHKEINNIIAAEKARRLGHGNKQSEYESQIEDSIRILSGGAQFEGRLWHDNYF